MHDSLINRKIPRALEQKLAAIVEGGEPALFTVVGELTLDSKYGQLVLIATEKELIVYDSGKDEVVSRTAYAAQDTEKRICSFTVLEPCVR